MAPEGAMTGKRARLPSTVYVDLTLLKLHCVYSYLLVSSPATREWRVFLLILFRNLNLVCQAQYTILVLGSLDSILPRRDSCIALPRPIWGGEVKYETLFLHCNGGEESYHELH